ncbi:MAG: hypothetical protein Q8P91_00885 [bacterium]|nr:hypothetical protein [bacterium]
MSVLSLNLRTIQDTAMPDFKFYLLTDVFSAEILRYIFSFAGIMLLVYLLIGGLQLMFAKGDPKAVQASWSKITNAATGFVIIFTAYWITQLVANVLNIQTMKDIFK